MPPNDHPREICTYQLEFCRSAKGRAVVPARENGITVHRDADPAHGGDRWALRGIVDGDANGTRLSPTISPLPSGVQVGEPPTGGTSNDATLAPSGVSIVNVPFPLGSEETPEAKGATPTANRVPSGENAVKAIRRKPKSNSSAGGAPGFMIQMALVPERLEMKASVPSGAKVGVEVMPLAGSMMSGCAAGAMMARARFARLLSVSRANRPPPNAR